MKKVNLVAIAIDCSSSMSTIRYDTEQAFREMLRVLREQARSFNQETFVTVVGFADTAYTILPLMNIQKINENTFSYHVNGWTALFDGAGLAIDNLLNHDLKLPRNSDISNLVLVYTDGFENKSTQVNADTLKSRIRYMDLLGNWTLAFQLPPGQAKDFSNKFGISLENIREWEATRDGIAQAKLATVSATADFYQARESGAKAMRSFYKPVTTDLSKVAVAQVKCKLDDLSHRLKSYNVEKESVVREFTEGKTKRPYVLGQTYYQLMKREEIQPNKAILIVENGKKAIWGGDGARDMLGLPKDTYAKVVPGNHANYDIYVQSTSVNRKLPRGTKVLIDTKQTVSMRPTWVEVK